MNLLIAWLSMLALHAGALLGVAWAIDSVPNLRGAWRELLWRTALFGCVLTATVQALVPQQSVIGRWHWPASTIAAPAESAPIPQAGNAGNAGIPIAYTPPPVSVIAQGHTVVQARAATGASGFLTIPSSSRRTQWLLVIWISGALLALARLLRGLVQLRRELAQAVPIASAELQTDVAALATCAGVEAPQLLWLGALPSPIAVAGRRIVLPRWALDTLDREQLQAMLAHELGHIVRGDPAWKILAAVWRALLWFIPPAGIAQRRLDDLAELACDAFAAQRTGNGHRLAECLATCAEHHGRRYTLDLAPAMAARQSSLMHRIERLLEGVSMDTRSAGLVSRGVAVLVLGAAVFCLPAIGFDAARAQAALADAHGAKQGSSHSSVSVHSDDDGSETMTVSLSDDSHKFSARVEGKITFTDDGTDIASIGGAGTATLEETIGGVTRRLELAERGGKLERRYFVDRSERPLDDEGRQWTTGVVLQLVRSGIGAEERAKRLYAKGGAPRVLDEITQIPTDYVRGIYLRALMGLAKLTPAELDRAVKLAGDMHSDYERRQALTAVFDKQALAAAEQVTFLHQALRFDSDYERAELLIGALPKLANTAEVRQAWLDAGLKVKSDYERRRTLQAMLARGNLDATQLATVIEASSSMSSDYEHRELLAAAAQQLHDPDAIAAPYARSTQKIGSDYERREALMALLRSGKIGVAGAGAVLDSAAQIGSSYECREVLVALARVMPDDEALHQRYRDVAKRLPDYDRTEAERALVR
jgi:beta-lactamase regulating signal transducer with metallopeptidase domain